MSGSITNYYEFGNTTNPSSIIFLLHGVGSNGEDLIQLAPLWAKDVPGEVLFISPDAPFECDMAPTGYQWFSLLDRSPAMLQAGISVTMPILQKFIDEQRSRFDLPMAKVALVGFSQGTMMSLYTAPRLPEKIAGVLGYSGALYGGEELLEDSNSVQKPPIRLIHGEADDVVPVQAYHAAQDVLVKAGFEVSGHTTPFLPHSIDEHGVGSGSAFLKEIFS